MVYSRKRDFLFIKGKKVAGTSVEMALSCVCGPKDIITPLVPIEEQQRLRLGGRGAQHYSTDRKAERRYLRKLARAGASERDGIPGPANWIFYEHMNLAQFEAHFGCIPTERIFGIERSPYAKVISSANMGSRFPEYCLTGKRMEFDLKHVRGVLEKRFANDSLAQHCLNIDRYRSADGHLRARLIRYEDLPNSFNALMAEFGIDVPTPLPWAKWGANSNEIDPLTVFSRQELDHINVVFAEEFDAFGYDRL